MRLAIVSRATPAHNPSGGMERHLDQLARGLSAAGHEVVVFTSALRSGRPGDAPSAGLQFVYVADTVPGRYFRGFWKKTARAVEAAHANSAFDVVISQSAGAWGLLRDASTSAPPVLAIMHGTARDEIRTALRAQPFHPKTYAKVILGAYRFWRWDRVLLPRCRRVIAVSSAVAHQLRADVPAISANLRVVHNGIALPEAHRADPAANSVVLYVGRVIAEKGVFVLLRAFARIASAHPQSRLRFVGGGSLEALKRESGKLGLRDRVSFGGPTPHAAIPEEYARAGLFAFPTLRDEGLPLSLLESMAAGLPVLTSARGGIVEAVRDGAEGILLSQVDEAHVASALDSLLGSPSLRARMGAEARDTAKRRFSEAAMLSAYQSELREVADPLP